MPSTQTGKKPLKQQTFQVTEEFLQKVAATGGAAHALIREKFPAIVTKFSLDGLIPNERKGSFRLFTNEQARTAGFVDDGFMQVRSCGDYYNQAFYLDRYHYDWKLVDDTGGDLLLIPTPRQR